ncbi:MAG: hypothetical protein VKS61_11785 [Candidatus Sericytochromatia bacterium]|nr:hypothetical protein [Candidatus Sericytochromatia bacterium]
MSQEVMGYFNPTVPPVPAYGTPGAPGTYGTYSAGAVPAPAPYGVPGGYTTTPSVPGQQPVATWDTWVPTSAADPYVAGLRTSASALAAVTGASNAAVSARFAVAKSLKLGGSRVSASAAKFAGRATQAAKLPKGMQAASSVAQKAQFTQGIRAGVGSAFRHTFLSIGNVARALGGAAILAVPIALVTNFLDHQAGKINEQQRNALIVADTAGYTVTGATATLVGGFVGSTFLGPAIGTMIGVAAGFGLGYVYEKFIRPQWGEWVRSAIYAPPAPPPTQPVDPYLPK